MSRGSRGASSRALALTLGLLTAACGTASNYLDPHGPRYAGEHAGPLPSGRDVRVVTFNIEHAKRVPEAIAILREYDSLRAPDVLALQEMDAPGAEAIARELGLQPRRFTRGRRTSTPGAPPAAGPAPGRAP